MPIPLNTVHMLGVVLAVFIVLGVGALARRINWLTPQADQSLLKLVVNILMPALILSATLGNKALSTTGNVLLPPIVGIVTVLAGFGLALAAARYLGRRVGLENSQQERTFALCAGLYNYAYIPIPLALQLFGLNTVAVLFVHNLGVELTMWTVGVLLISGHLGKRWYTRLITPPTIAIAGALLLNATGAPRLIPGFVTKALEMLGNSAIPLSLLLVGATIADEFREIAVARGGRVIALAAILRLGILPAAFLLLAWLLPATRELKNVIILQAAMPSAVFPVVLTRHYGGHSPTALRVVVSSALISLLTTPLWLSLALWLLGK